MKGRIMDLGDLISPDAVIPTLKAKNKKHALQLLAAKAAEIAHLDAGLILEALLQRENLGSTGVGCGIAIPHGRIPGLPRIMSVFARLDVAIPYDAIDGEPVDLMFLLLAPEHAGAEHLKALARISRLLRDPQAIEKLRASNGRDALHALLTQPLASAAA